MTKQYGFTSEGVQAFLDDIVGDVMEAMHETGCYEDKVHITVGSRTITIPMVSETYEAIDTALHDALTIWNTEYEREEKNDEDE